jgi:hypothetical protein
VAQSAWLDQTQQAGVSGAYYNEHDPKTAAWLRRRIASGDIAPGDVDERSITDVQPDDLRGYTQVHLFAGIGGWSYATRLAGIVDDQPIWTGSCPCQPFSVAGQDEAPTTSGTCGRKCDGSSPSADLQQYLVSRLPALLASRGSLLYELTWKSCDMPSGPPICALRASALRIADSESTLSGWPTPSARDWKDTPGMATTATNPDGSTRTRLDQLPRVANLAGWGTPDGPARITADGTLQTGSTAAMESGGQLNPDHSRWMMGYPTGWDD